MNNLPKEIQDNAKKVHTTELKMSIGEIINLYRDGEITIDPEFQRLFVWDTAQKSRFIESILIGIPIPSIFVQQTSVGVWEVIDGLQRLSTILEFVGILKKPEGGTYERLQLKKTKFLPSLQGIYYDTPGEEHSFDQETRLIFKRFPLNIVILKRESDDSAKYELFDRLNSGGTALEPQQIRNAIFITEKPEAINLIKKLSKQPYFSDVVNVSDKDINKAYDDELVLRFFAYTQIAEKFGEYNDSIKDFLDGYLRDSFNNVQKEDLENSFKKFFEFLGENLGEKVFHGKRGGFSIVKFEAISIGLFPFLERLEEDKETIVQKINNIQEEAWFKEATTGNSYARNRLKVFLDNSSYFDPTN